MSHLGVDLLRSDTGHYMQWPPVDDAPTAPVALPVPLPAARTAERGRSWISMLGAGTPTAPALVAGAGSTPALGSRDRVSGYLSLVNWLVLLLMFCAFLLAKTLPADTALTGGTVAQSCTVAAAACAETSAP